MIRTEWIFIGGSGVTRAYRILSEEASATVTFGRHLYEPWGVNGGEEGSVNKFYIEKANGKVDGPFGMYARYPLKKGDVLRLVTGTGGGYGHPFLRPVEKVINDVRNGYFTIEQAKDKFGVILDENYELLRETKERVQYLEKNKDKQNDD